MTPASLDELLKKWEKEAKEDWVSGLDGVARQRKLSRRVCNLIAVVRKQREAFHTLLVSADHGLIGNADGVRVTISHANAEAERILRGNS